MSSFQRVFTNLSIQVVSKSFLQSALYGVLSGQQRHVVGEFVVSGNDGSLPVRVVLWSTRSAKDLQDIQNTQVDKGTLPGIVNLSTLSR